MGCFPDLILVKVTAQHFPGPKPLTIASAFALSLQIHLVGKLLGLSTTIFFGHLEPLFLWKGLFYERLSTDYIYWAECCELRVLFPALQSWLNTPLLLIL